MSWSTDPLYVDREKKLWVFILAWGQYLAMLSQLSSMLRYNCRQTLINKCDARKDQTLVGHVQLKCPMCYIVPLVSKKLQILSRDESSRRTGAKAKLAIFTEKWVLRNTYQIHKFQVSFLFCLFWFSSRYLNRVCLVLVRSTNKTLGLC